MFHMFASNFGTLGVVLWSQLAPGLVFGWLVLDFRPPASAQAALFFVISVALGYLIYFFLSFIVGLLSVVTLDIRSYGWAYYSLVRFTSGQMVPLWMFPAPLGAILSALPFQAIFYLPMSLYIGVYEGNPVRAIGAQLAWVVALFLASRLFWARLQQRITIQGG
jgi:ABC-2 type transport system permease protein